MALANSNSGASSAAAAGSVVLVSNLNEKVMMGRIYVANILPPLCRVNTSSPFFLTCLLTLLYLSSLVCVLDLLPVLLPQDDYSSCSVRSLWYVSLSLPTSLCGYFLIHPSAAVVYCSPVLCMYKCRDVLCIVYVQLGSCALYCYVMYMFEYTCTCTCICILN